MYLQYDIEFSGEMAAGLWPYSDTVIVEVKSGNPGGEPGEFEEYIRQSIANWFDGAGVKCVRRENG